MPPLLGHRHRVGLPVLPFVGNAKAVCAIDQRRHMGLGFGLSRPIPAHGRRPSPATRNSHLSPIQRTDAQAEQKHKAAPPRAPHARIHNRQHGHAFGSGSGGHSQAFRARRRRARPGKESPHRPREIPGATNRPPRKARLLCTPKHAGLVQRMHQTVQRLTARRRMGDQLAQHRVVKRRHHQAALDRMVKAHSRPCRGRRLEIQHGARLRQVTGIFSAQTHFDRRGPPGARLLAPTAAARRAQCAIATQPDPNRSSASVTGCST